MVVRCRTINNRNVADFVLGITTGLFRYSVYRKGPLTIGLYVGPVKEKGLVALWINKKEEHTAASTLAVKPDAIIFTRNVDIDIPSMDNHDIANQIWINVLSPDESITIADIYDPMFLPTGALIFVDTSNLGVDEVDYLKEQKETILFMDIRCIEDHAIDNTKAYATYGINRPTSSLF